MKQGKIYKLISESTNLIYIGSTIRTLERRFIEHKCNFNTDRQITSKDIMKYDDVKIELIEIFEYDNLIELQKRERYFIELNKDIVVNKVTPLRTKKEYHSDNREYIIARVKKWYIVNKDKAKERRGKLTNCICGDKYTLNHKSRHMKTQRHFNNFEKIKLLLDTNI